MPGEKKNAGRKPKEKTDTYNSLFASRLRLLLESSETTQISLAEQLKTTRQSVGNWTLGKSQPDFDTLVKIADLFNTSTDFLLGKQPKKFNKSRHGNTKDVFSERICLLREEKGLSRQKVADDLGITRASLEYYEKGLRTPNLNIIREISDYYGVSVDYLFGKIDTATYSMDIKFISEYTGLSEKNAIMLTELKRYNLIINSAIEGVLNGISDHFNRK